jgi:hypothetical protein
VLEGGTMLLSEAAAGGVYGGAGVFTQNGGLCCITNALTLGGTTERFTEFWSSYTLTGGLLRCGSLSMQPLSWFSQTGGPNLVAGTLTVAGAYCDENRVYQLGGGTLASSETIVDGSIFEQRGGFHVVTNSLTLKFSGVTAGYKVSTYRYSSGQLVASNISIGGLFDFSEATVSKTVVNNGIFSLNGTLRTGNVNESLGRFLLAGNSWIEFSDGPSIYVFAASAGGSWMDGAYLVVSNWNGSANGGGLHQLRFGNDRNGLAASQVRRIGFSNPVGFVAGNYPAEILAAGEVVPVEPPTLDISGTSGRIVLTWPGPYLLQVATNIPGPYFDVSAATSPYTNPMSAGSQQFFRLRN